LGQKVERFEDLEIWKLSIKLATDIFKPSQKGQLDKDFGTKDQIRRASLSVSSNIAEGFDYNNNKQFIRFLNYSKGSLGELRSQIFLLKEFNYNNNEFEDLTNQSVNLIKKVKSLINYLNTKIQ
jgi:four helix bundle protein